MATFGGPYVNQISGRTPYVRVVGPFNELDVNMLLLGSSKCVAVQSSSQTNIPISADMLSYGDGQNTEHLEMDAASSYIIYRTSNTQIPSLQFRIRLFTKSSLPAGEAVQFSSIVMQVRYDARDTCPEQVYTMDWNSLSSMVQLKCGRAHSCAVHRTCTEASA